MKLYLTSAIVFFILSPLAQAKHNSDYHHANKHSRYTIKAKVIDFSPVYKYRNIKQPYTYCEPLAVPKIVGRTSDRSAAIAGGIVGGLIGHSASHDKHKGLGTIMGAVIGSSLAHNIAHHNRQTYQIRSENCKVTYKTVRKERVLDGYNVTYRSKGRIYRTFTQEKPGKYIRIYY